MSRWIVIKNRHGETHIIPDCDLRPHRTETDCWCNPRDDEGPWVHPSLDGRERIERGKARRH